MSDLVTLTIDGTETSVPKGTLIVDAAKRIGNDIPVFCYHPKMEPVGMCRMCLVEVGLPMRDRATGEFLLDEDGAVKVGFRGLQTGCTVQVSEGMVVRTNTDVAKDARADIVEFLLSSHPLDCPICDKGGECPLQNLTMAHGKGESRMVYTDKLKMQKHVPLGEMIYLDRERCIQCARCVRFQEEVVDDPVIRFHNRGRSLEIVTFSDPGFDSYWSGNTTDICPVGALTTADFRFGARPWELTPAASLCTHCPVGCNLTMSTRREAKSGGRQIIKRIMPRQNESVNEIWICDKGRFAHHFVESTERLAKPLVRKNGELVEASWDEALELVATKLQEAETTAGVAGARLSNEDLYQFQKLFRKGLKSDHVDLAQRRLAGGDVVAQVGLASGSNLGDLGKGDAILVVASDLHEEAPVWWMRVKLAAERGATVVVANLRPTRLDKFAAHTIYYEPGQALATVRQLVNMAKVEQSESANAIDAAADALVKANNLVAFYGYEGLTYDETDALAKLLGNLLLIRDGESHAGKTNSGLVPVWPHSNTQGAWDMGVHPAFLPGYKPVKAPGMDANAIYASVADGGVNALYVVGADPVGDGLMAGRGKLSFLVVEELFMTATAVVADVVLPAQSWAEREGTFTNGERRVQRYYPAVAPVGESRADWQILAQIGEKVGAGKPAFAASLAFKELTKAIPHYKGMDYRSLAKVEKQWPDVGGEDLYYGGNAYENKAGLGQQWAVAAEKGAVAHYDVAEGSTTTNGLQLVTAVALYTPGTLLNHSDVIQSRLAQPTLYLSEADAGELQLATQDNVSVAINGETVTAVVVVDVDLNAGIAVLKGAGTAVMGTVVPTITRLGQKAEEIA